MFKKIISLISAVALICLTATTALAEPSVEYKQVPREYPSSLLVLGDSIATGYGLENYNASDNYSAENYGQMLSKKYGISEEGYRNYAINGQTSEQLLEKIKNGTYDNSLSCEVTVISIGGNDLLTLLIDLLSKIDFSVVTNGTFNIKDLLVNEMPEELDKLSKKADENVKVFDENLKEIVKLIKEKNPDGYVILQTLYNPMDTGIKQIDSLYQEKIEALNQVISSEENCIIADVNAMFSNSDDDLIQKDMTHPNEEGHKLIFQAVDEEISQFEFYNTIELEKTTVDVNKPKSQLKFYIIALSCFGGLILLTIIISIVVKVKTARKKRK